MKSKHAPALAGFLLVLVALFYAFSSQSNEQIVVTHGVIKPTATVGEGLATVRTFIIEITADGKSGDNYYLVGTLTTVGKVLKGEDEIRSANLNFVLGDISNQVVLGGVSLYPPVGATIAPGTETIRPIIGGSGEYEGAEGQVISKNLGDAGWSHILELD